MRLTDPLVVLHLHPLVGPMCSLLGSLFDMLARPLMCAQHFPLRLALPLRKHL